MQSFEMNQLYLVATILISLILGTNAFSYKDAKNWGKKYPECNGKNQSPIILESTGLDAFPVHKKNLRLTDFHKLPKKVTIKNTGHTVEMKADWSGEPPRLTDGPLHGSYVFEKATFHWAPKKWSDEVIHNPELERTFWHEMEMHMFFYRTDLKSFEKAQTQKGGLAVLNMWLSGVDGTSDDAFKNLEGNLHKVQSPNSTAEIPPVRFANIFDDEVAEYTFYEGSLDYPPCSESVTWFIGFNDFAVSNGLLKEFRKIKLAEGDVSNVRPPQALNKRQVKVVFNYNMPENFGL